MHEFALAEAVVRAAEREVRDRDSVTILVKVGELQQIQAELFEFSLKEVIPAGDERLSRIRFEVEIEEVRFECRGCGLGFGRGEAHTLEGWDLDEAIHFIPEMAHAFIRCPRCDSPDFEIISGRGVTIETIGDSDG